MSVDYDANYGIGYEITASESLEADLEDGLREWLYNKEGKDFKIFEVGSYYDDDAMTIYLCISNNLIDESTDLQSAKNMVEQEANRLGVDVTGDFGIVGGILVW